MEIFKLLNKNIKLIKRENSISSFKNDLGGDDFSINPK